MTAINNFYRNSDNISALHIIVGQRLYMHTHKTSIKYDSPLELHAFAACAKKRMTAQKCSVPILDEISCRVCLGCEYAKFPAGNGLNSFMYVVLYMSPFEPLFSYKNPSKHLSHSRKVCQ